MTKKILVPGLIAGVVLLILSFAMLYGAVYLFPNLAEQYYSPVFREEGNYNWLFYIHPFILALALAWFWDRFKEQFNGSLIVRDLELGLVYTLVASLPAMLITFSALDVTVTMVLTWLLYGFVQAAIAGLIFARMNP
ncbi:MAG: hypothetical protein IPJ40_20000 [Saprospirales bacterium]|nr:hypothetical protein [Saprospirales bacterium]